MLNLSQLTPILKQAHVFIPYKLDSDVGPSSIMRDQQILYIIKHILLSHTEGLLVFDNAYLEKQVPTSLPKSKSKLKIGHCSSEDCTISRKSSWIDILLASVNDPHLMINPAVLHTSLAVLIDMLRRPRPPSPADFGRISINDFIYEPKWCEIRHALEYLYKTLFCIIENKNVVVPHDTFVKLISALLYSFQSSDPRELTYLKTILYLTFDNFSSYRAIIRRKIADLFLDQLQCDAIAPGSSKIIDVYTCIVRGFAKPLKEEHIIFFKTIILPLHRVKHINDCTQSLANCVKAFLEKDPKLSKYILGTLLAYWPVHNTSKELIFCEELEDILAYISNKQFMSYSGPICTRLALNVTSPCFQIAEKTLLYWENDHIVNLLVSSSGNGLNMLLRALMDTSQTHWLEDIRFLAENMIRVIYRADPINLLNDTKAHLDSMSVVLNESATKRQMWAHIIQCRRSTHLEASSLTIMGKF